MPSPFAQTFTLVPHPSSEGRQWRLGGQIERAEGELRLNYFLEGDLDRLRLPKPRVPRFADGLWRHTCFEMFVALAGEEAYHEFNFSPSGEWAAYPFSRYRERGPCGEEWAPSLEPVIAVRRSAGRLELDAALRLDRLSPRHGRSRLLLALSAVVEEGDGSLSYWALRHPGPRPDFHHPDAFVLEFDEIRN